jgi:hypothetical protein
VNARLAVNVYTPDATNYKKSVVWIDIIQPELSFDPGFSCNFIGFAAGTGIYAGESIALFDAEFTGTATAAPNDMIQFGGGDNSTLTVTCPGWLVQGTRCLRGYDDSPTVQWSFRMVVGLSSGSPPRPNCGSFRTGAALAEMWQIAGQGRELTWSPDKVFTCSLPPC